MIREVKSPNAPSSLSAHNQYDGQDVLDQLFIDHHEKCYLCELKVKQHYQVEHLKSKENFLGLKFEWTNLFLSDDYCNGKKNKNFDEILNPNENNIEEIIEQRIDSINRKALFKTTNTSIAAQKTVELLGRLFNGTFAPKLRKRREDEFYKEVERIINAFNMTLLNYLNNPNPQTEQTVRDELSIDKELLGFKYWIIKDKPDLFAVFGNDINWNKTA
jgi:hypothetical protein